MMLCRDKYVFMLIYVQTHIYIFDKNLLIKNKTYIYI